MLGKRNSTVIKSIAICATCAWVLCACGDASKNFQGSGVEESKRTVKEWNEVEEEKKETWGENKEKGEENKEIEEENKELVGESKEAVEEIKKTEYEALFMNMEVIKPYKALEDTNPIITQRFGADPYAMVYEDRVYFYMTGDTIEYGADGKVTENTYGKITTINVVSTEDMVNFQDHGAVYAAGSKGAAKWAFNSWAPAAAWKEINGKVKFFLYFANSGGGIGVLTSDSPTGPFEDPLGEALISKNTPNCADIVWLFDPAVLVDDDGRAYLYFGGGIPKDQAANPGTVRAVELGEDMISIVGEPVTIDAPYVFEDSGIHKFNNKYYYTYCTNFNVDQAGTDKYGFVNGEIVCMESDSPLGPFTFKETILENPGKYFGLGGNNHHCVFSFRDKWYITYHTRVLEGNMGIQKGYRCTHIDSFTMQEDGTIGLIKQTIRGREQLSYVDAYKRHNATEVAVMSGMSTVAADAITDFYGSGTMALGEIQTGSFVKVQGVDFGSEAPSKWSLEIKNDSDEVGMIQLRVDGLDGEILGYLRIDENTGVKYTLFEANLDTQITGVHDIYMIFYGDKYNVLTWQFEK